MLTLKRILNRFKEKFFIVLSPESMLVWKSVIQLCVTQTPQTPPNLWSRWCIVIYLRFKWKPVDGNWLHYSLSKYSWFHWHKNVSLIATLIVLGGFAVIKMTQENVVRTLNLFFPVHHWTLSYNYPPAIWTLKWEMIPYQLCIFYFIFFLHCRASGWVMHLCSPEADRLLPANIKHRLLWSWQQRPTEWAQDV